MDRPESVIQTTARYFLLASSLMALVLYYFRFSLHPGEGMELYTQAAECLVSRLPMNTCKPDFTYPSVFGFMMILFIHLPMWARHIAWYLLLLGLTYASFRLAEDLIVEALPHPLTGKRLVLFRVVSTGLALNFILAVFEHQAYDVLVLFFCSCRSDWTSKKQMELLSLGIGLVAAIKATPLLFLPYLLLKKGWKPFFLRLGCYLGFSLLPDAFLSIGGGREPIMAIGSSKSRCSRLSTKLL